MNVIMKFKDGSKLVRYEIYGVQWSAIIDKNGTMIRSIPTKGYPEGTFAAETCKEYLVGEDAMIYRHLLWEFSECAEDETD